MGVVDDLGEEGVRPCGEGMGQPLEAPGVEDGVGASGQSRREPTGEQRDEEDERGDQIGQVDECPDLESTTNLVRGSSS